MHHQAKPLLGGAAIYAAFMITVIGNLLILWWIDNQNFPSNNWLFAQLNYLANFAAGTTAVLGELLGLLLGGTVLFIVGLVDDRLGMNPLIKLVGQLIAAIILYMASIQINLFIQQPFINFMLTLFWIVLITNSFNLLDNMDGLSAGVAMICLILLGVAAHLVNQQGFISSINFVLAGCLAGFLRYNINPSSIFMGDTGSLFVGFMVSALTVQTTFYVQGEMATSWSVVMPFVILAVPIFDTVSVICIRIKNKKPIYLGDKNHFSHRLVALGMSHRRAVFFIHVVTFSVGCSALVLAIIDESFFAYIVLLQTVAVFVIISMLENIKKNGNGNQK